MLCGKLPGSLNHLLRDTAGVGVVTSFPAATAYGFGPSFRWALFNGQRIRSTIRTGLTDFQNVLDMERALFQQQDAQAVSEGAAAQYLVAVYKAFGGGWDESSRSVAQTP